MNAAGRSKPVSRRGANRVPKTHTHTHNTLQADFIDYFRQKSDEFDGNAAPRRAKDLEPTRTERGRHGLRIELPLQPFLLLRQIPSKKNGGGAQIPRASGAAQKRTPTQNKVSPIRRGVSVRPSEKPSRLRKPIRTLREAFEKKRPRKKAITQETVRRRRRRPTDPPTDRPVGTKIETRGRERARAGQPRRPPPPAAQRRFRLRRSAARQSAVRMSSIPSSAPRGEGGKTALPIRKRCGARRASRVFSPADRRVGGGRRRLEGGN